MRPAGLEQVLKPAELNLVARPWPAKLNFDVRTAGLN